MRSLIFGPELDQFEVDLLWLSKDSAKSRGQAFEQFVNNSAVSVFSLPELGYTKSLQCYLDRWLGLNFCVCTSNLILTDSTVGFATSKPDLILYHKDNFVVEKEIVGGICPMDPDINDK